MSLTPQHPALMELGRITISAPKETQRELWEWRRRYVAQCAIESTTTAEVFVRGNETQVKELMASREIQALTKLGREVAQKAAARTEWHDPAGNHHLVLALFVLNGEAKP